MTITSKASAGAHRSGASPLRWEVRDAEPTCGVPSPGGRMRCEFPPDHRIGVERDKATYHYGRDARGAWRSWPMKGVSDDVEA